VVNPVFRAGAYDTSFIESELARAGSSLAAPQALEDETREIVLALVAWQTVLQDESGSTDSPRGGAVVRGARITLPKQAPVEVDVPLADAGAMLRVCVEGREIELAVKPVAGSGSSETEPVLFDVSRGGFAVRVSVVRKKNADFEVGLRERVLKLKSERR
jgi:hypothetical protein